ncbi:MAG: sensor histidine kinase [Bacillota bacterium]|nr:sensor histidine kinase [Bacillota bacterium]
MKKIKQYQLKGIYYRSFIFLIVIPILIVFSAAIFIIRQMMEDSAIRNIERVQKNMCMNLENEIQDASLRLSHFLYVNEGAITKAAAKTDTYDIEKKRIQAQELDRYFNFAMCPIEDIAAATFFMKSGNYTNLKEDFVISMDDIKEKDWYYQALENKNKVAVGSFNKKITPSKYGQNPFYIAVAIAPDIRVDTSGCIETAVLIVVSDLEKMVKLNLKDSTIGNTILLDEKNRVLYDPSGKAELIKNQEIINGKYKFKENRTGKSYVAVAREVMGTQWRIVNVVNSGKITGAFLRTASIILMIITAVMLLFYIFSHYFLKNIIHPVNDIIQGLKVVQTGNLDVHIAPKGQSEIRVMIHSFNQMVRRLKILIKENEQQQLKKQEAEMKALQSQINPHFLVNSLSSIRFMAQVSRFEGIRKMAEALIKILSCSFRSNQSTYTIKEEMEMLDSFIFLMSIRYSDGFQFEKEVDEKCLEYHIPRLILQPLVENSIVHAFTEKEDIGLIKVSIYEEQEWIYLMVEDNGKGISKTQREQIFSWEEKDDNYSIGIRNVYTRLQLNYGENSIFYIDSKEGSYTKIKIALKKKAVEK